MGKTSEISGKVIEIFPNREVQSHSRRIKYVYSVDDSFYVDFKKLGTKDARQEIGNDLKLIYSIKKPEKIKLKNFIQNMTIQTEKDIIQPKKMVLSNCN